MEKQRNSTGVEWDHERSSLSTEVCLTAIKPNRSHCGMVDPSTRAVVWFPVGPRLNLRFKRILPQRSLYYAPPVARTDSHLRRASRWRAWHFQRFDGLFIAATDFPSSGKRVSLASGPGKPAKAEMWRPNALLKSTKNQTRLLLL